MYVSPKQPLMKTIERLSEGEFISALTNLRYLCWGQEGTTDDISERYTKFIDDNSPYRVADISGHGAIKLLSIVHPQEILPLGSHYKSGNTDYSIGGFLLRLGLGAVHGSTYGAQIIDAHKRLRDLLADHFGDDSLEMGFFLQWLALQDPLPMEDSSQSASQTAVGSLDILVKRFLQDSGFPTEIHKEQRRLREQWTQKLAPENVASLSRKDLAAYTSYAVDSGEYVNPATDIPRWIRDLDDTHYGKLLDNIGDLCWGKQDLPTRIDRLVHWRGSRKDTGTKGFAQGNISATLAICQSDSFLPVWYQEGPEGRKQMLHMLGLPEPRGTTLGEQIVDANDRLRKHLASYLDDDPLAIACFLYWLFEQETDLGGHNKPDDEVASLSVLAQRFRAESGYPTEADKEQERLRAEWAEKLAPENIADFSRLDLTGVASRGTLHRARYVYPDVQGVMKWIRQLDEDEYSGLLDSIDYLCWGEDEAWVRYDHLTDRRNPRRLRGYANPTAIRLLAITHPKDFLPLGPYPGVFSRLRRYLHLDRPQGSSYGQRVMDANNRLLEQLEPHFGDDTLEMSAFLEWLLRHKQPPRPADLNELAHKLLVDVEFLEDIVSLLEDKGQVILYGPPGTGKTFLARELAKALAPDEACRALVQFHPSTSYEDFFEGYRPAGTGNDGGIRYELTPGPLARMAEQAEATDEQHVMIIDEINRGNLPRVLGELLFLLEYRDESVQTLHRVEEPFSLPKNLWFIGTMNTADRSIALVDAALRRRFHFVPFFPDSGPMAGLLDRWLEREEEPTWVGDLVDKVNAELADVLEGSHLLLGPSHFMKEYGSPLDAQRERLRRIWEYNIEPFIEDQFFGSPDQIARFRFDAVMRRNGPAAESDVDASDDGDDPESTDPFEDS